MQDSLEAETEGLRTLPAECGEKTEQLQMNRVRSEYNSALIGNFIIAPPRPIGIFNKNFYTTDKFKDV